LVFIGAFLLAVVISPPMRERAIRGLVVAVLMLIALPLVKRRTLRMQAKVNKERRVHEDE
jgi:uncharacterized membrane protein YjgN (DUF898 family)